MPYFDGQGLSRISTQNVDGEWGEGGTPVENKKIVTKISKKRSWTDQKKAIAHHTHLQIMFGLSVLKSAGLCIKNNAHVAAVDACAY